MSDQVKKQYPPNTIIKVRCASASYVPGYILPGKIYDCRIHATGGRAGWITAESGEPWYCGILLDRCAHLNDNAWEVVEDAETSNDPIRPAEKPEGIERILEAAHPGQANRRALGLCATCGGNRMQRDRFRDPLSAKEGGISGMCQRCQDGVFAEPYDSETEAVTEMLGVVATLQALMAPFEGSGDTDITAALDKAAQVAGRAAQWLVENDDDEGMDDRDGLL